MYYIVKARSATLFTANIIALKKYYTHTTDVYTLRVILINNETFFFYFVKIV